jgi:separase
MVILHFIDNGSPSFVGNLWDITDRDFDKFTMEVFKLWGFIEDPDVVGRTRLNLPKAIANSRDICTFPHLNGAAIVNYGLPIKLKP